MDLTTINGSAVLNASANHSWRPRYDQALANPNVSVTVEGVTSDYVAKPISGEAP